MLTYGTRALSLLFAIRCPEYAQKYPFLECNYFSLRCTRGRSRLQWLWSMTSVLHEIYNYISRFRESYQEASVLFPLWYIVRGKHRERKANSTSTSLPCLMHCDSLIMVPIAQHFIAHARSTTVVQSESEIEVPIPLIWGTTVGRSQYDSSNERYCPTYRCSKTRGRIPAFPGWKSRGIASKIRSHSNIPKGLVAF